MPGNTTRAPQFNKPGVFKLINGTPALTTTQNTSGISRSLGYTPGRGLAPTPQATIGSGISYVPGNGLQIIDNEISVIVGTGLSFNSAGQLINSAAVPTPIPNGGILQGVGGVAAWVAVLAALPFFTNSGGTLASTFHCVFGTVTAAGASTSVTFTSSAVFSSASSYWLGIFHTTGAGSPSIPVPTAITASSFTFASVNTNLYSYLAFGT